MDDESLYEAWERYKELLRKCPYHGIPHCIQLETFYNGLNAHTRMVVDTSANGALLSKSYNEAYEIIERNSPLIPIRETFPEEHILKVNHVHNTPWFADIANFLACGLMPIDKTYH